MPVFAITSLCMLDTTWLSSSLRQVVICVVGYAFLLLNTVCCLLAPQVNACNGHINMLLLLHNQAEAFWVIEKLVVICLNSFSVRPQVSDNAWYGS